MTADRKAAVFLSYASQDADVARRLCDALRTEGVELMPENVDKPVTELHVIVNWSEELKRRVPTSGR